MTLNTYIILDGVRVYIGSPLWRRIVARPAYHLLYNKVPTSIEWRDFLRTYGIRSNIRDAYYIKHWFENLEDDVKVFLEQTDILKEQKT
jgi:hypothetical protein